MLAFHTNLGEVNIQQDGIFLKRDSSSSNGRQWALSPRLYAPLCRFELICESGGNIYIYIPCINKSKVLGLVAESFKEATVNVEQGLCFRCPRFPFLWVTSK